MVDVFASDEFEEWFATLPAGEQRSVEFLVDLLETTGLALGSPYSSAIKGATFALRELRARGSAPLRVFYAFDPARAAYIIIGGNKRGDDQFYETMIPLAEKIWEQYLRERS